MFYVIRLSMEDRDEILLVTEKQNRKPEIQFNFVLFVVFVFFVCCCNVPGKQIRPDRTI